MPNCPVCSTNLRVISKPAEVLDLYQFNLELHNDFLNDLREVYFNYSQWVTEGRKKKKNPLPKNWIFRYDRKKNEYFYEIQFDEEWMKGSFKLLPHYSIRLLKAVKFNKEVPALNA